MTRVLLVGDRPVVLAGLGSHLAHGGALAVVDGAPPDALLLTTELHPEVIVVDSPGGFLLCHELKQLARRQRVVLHVAHRTPQLLVAAWVAGAEGLAGAGTPPSRLTEIVRLAAAGRRTLPRPAIPAVRAAGRRLEPIDLSVFGMRMHDVPSHEISGALRLDPLEVDRRVRSLVAHLSRDQSHVPEADWARRSGRAGRNAGMSACQQ